MMNILSISEAKEFSSNKNIIITGVTGQDGSYMVDYLLNNTSDYIIFGGVRRLSVNNHKNIEHIKSERFHLVYFDSTDSHNISSIIKNLNPSYFINFAGQSFVASSWDLPKQTFETNTNSVMNILESIRQHSPDCMFYNAGSSEEFGDVVYSPQDENHPLKPRSPYAASKAAARQIVKVYRESYNLYAIQGWLFNHESQRRGEEFVTRKITKNVARIVKELKNSNHCVPMKLGNINAKRDWSYAPDFIDGVWKMLNQKKSCLKDYVLASGENHTIKEFVEESFKIAGIDSGKWVGEGLDEKYTTNSNVLVKINPNFFRPAEVELLVGNSNLIKKELGWYPKVSFKTLVELMTINDLTYNFITTS